MGGLLHCARISPCGGIGHINFLPGSGELDHHQDANLYYAFYMTLDVLVGICQVSRFVLFFSSWHIFQRIISMHVVELIP